MFRSALPDAEVVVGPLSTTVPYFAALVQLAVDQGRASGARDSLTRVYSRHTLLAMLGQSLEEAKRRQRALTLAFVDLSGLKAINEAAGHHAGDAALREMAQAMQASIRKSDTLGRYGGDEFLIGLPETTRAGAERLMARLAAKVASPALGLRYGLASYPQDGDTVDALVNKADEELRRQKRTTQGQQNLPRP